MLPHFKPAGNWKEEWKDVGHEETEEPRNLKQSLHKDWAIDDVSGVPLGPELVKEAREVDDCNATPMSLGFTPS